MTAENEVVATFHGVEVLKAPWFRRSHYKCIRSHDYERPKVEAGLANLRATDRVVELGTGVGLVSAAFSKNVPTLKILSFEGNALLLPHIAKLHTHNGISDRISVRNQIVVADPTEVGGALLPLSINPWFMSSANANNEQETAEEETFEVPTIHYDDVRAAFPHNVLVMDIEGSELDLLTKMNLEHIDLILVEFHPKIYGAKRVHDCKEVLARKGFVIDEYSSAEQVITFKTPDRAKTPFDQAAITSRYEQPRRYSLEPDKPIASKISHYDKAVLAQQPKAKGWQIRASVYDSERQVIDQAICWLSHNRSATVLRSHPRRKRIVDLAGRWLFGGRIHEHFGHTLTESIGRIWALDHIDDPIDGVLFFTADPGTGQGGVDKVHARLREVMDLPDIPWKLADTFYRAEHLIVPPQACGINRLMFGAPEFRDFVSKRIRRDVEGTGARKLYISRSGTFGKHGRIFLGERLIENYLVEEGYKIFHPERHSWSEQLAHYVSADSILGPDGSPFHLVTYSNSRDSKVGIIKRRPGTEAKQMVRQAQYFGRKNCHELEHLGRFWSTAGSRRSGHDLSAEIKLGSLSRELRELGFISGAADWPDLTDHHIEEELAAMAQSANRDVIPVSSGSEDISHFPKMRGSSPSVVMVRRD